LVSVVEDEEEEDVEEREEEEVEEEEEEDVGVELEKDVDKDEKNFQRPLIAEQEVEVFGVREFLGPCFKLPTCQLTSSLDCYL
jgi:hypothetical protein